MYRLITSRFYIDSLFALIAIFTIYLFVSQLSDFMVRNRMLSDMLSGAESNISSADTLIHSMLMDDHSDWLTHFSGPIGALARAENLWQQGSRDEAVNIWRGLARSDYYYATLALRASRSGDTEQASRTGEISLSIADSARTEMAVIYSKLCDALRADPAAALPWCIRYAATTPNGWAHYRVASLYAETGAYEQALPILEEGLRAGNPSAIPTLYYKIGEIQRTLQNWRASATAYQDALRSGFSEPIVYRRLAFMLAELGDMRRACENYAISLEKGVEDTAGSRETFGKCATLLGQ